MLVRLFSKVKLHHINYVGSSNKVQCLVLRIPKMWWMQYLEVTHGGDCNSNRSVQYNQRHVFFLFEVQEESPALRAGLEPFFDFILSIGNTRLVSYKPVKLKSVVALSCPVNKHSKYYKHQKHPVIYV